MPLYRMQLSSFCQTAKRLIDINYKGDAVGVVIVLRPNKPKLETYKMSWMQYKTAEIQN